MTPSPQAYNQGRLRACLGCGKEFKPDCDKQKYCCHQCSCIKKTGAEVVCLNCQKVFRPDGPVAARRRKYCSPECRKVHFVGANRPSYRGIRRADRGWTWKERQTKARERDGGKCVSLIHDPNYVSYRVEMCSVDHIIPYRVVMGWIQGGESVDPNHIDNLACLCRRCHQIKTTRIESRLMVRDVNGFVSGLSSLLPQKMVGNALSLYGLSEYGKEITVAKEWIFDRRPSDKPIELLKSRGEKHWKSKLTEKQALEILSRRNEPRKVVAAIYGVSPQYVSQLICGRKWKWLQAPTCV